MEAFPRVLFCTAEIPQSVNAGSMQLFRALQGYPVDRLMVLGPAPESDAQRLPCRYETLQLLTYRLACTRWRGWASGLNALNTVFEPQLARSERLTRPFEPQLIATVMDKLSYYKHAWGLARRLRVPLLTITMDDPQTFERAHPLLEPAYDRFLRRMYNNSSVSLGVSREMCEYLEAKFGRASEVFYFGPPEGMSPRPPEQSRSLRAPPHLTLGYAGSLGLGYREGILAMLPALEACGARLNLYTRDQHALLAHPAIMNRGFLPPDRLWPTVQSECDAMILPYAFEGPMTRVYRTHFPTKLSEYCWIGMPMLLIGPADATGVRWGDRHPAAALTCKSADANHLGPMLERLRTDAGARAAMASAAAIIARDEFDPIAIRGRFHGLLKRAASPQPGQRA